MELRQLIQDYLNEAKVMQLATVSGGRPWICTVNFAVDDDWNLYWMSMRSARHSAEVRGGSQVAVAIVKDPSVKRGLQIEGLATELAGDDLRTAHQVYGQRYGDSPARLEEAESGDSSTRTYYRVKPTSIKLFDLVNFPDSPAQQIPWTPSI